MEYKLGSIVVMKKEHPCKTNRFEVVRVGADIKIKCINCGRVVMMSRVEFNKKIKKVEVLWRKRNLDYIQHFCYCYWQ